MLLQMQAGLALVWMLFHVAEHFHCISDSTLCRVQLHKAASGGIGLSTGSQKHLELLILKDSVKLQLILIHQEQTRMNGSSLK